MMNERRSSSRRKFGYYMPVIDNNSHKIVGHLSDISLSGFKLDSQKSLSVNTVYQLRLDLTPEFSSRPNIVFFARVVWCQPDPASPMEFINGFQVVNIAPDEQAIFERIAEKYGVPENKWGNYSL
jgi:hypothetical protein